MIKQSSIKNGTLISYFVIIFNIVGGLLYTPWMISKIGKADYGLYILVTSFLAYFTVDYGLWQAINKMVAEQHVKGDIQAQNKIVSVANSIYICIDCCIIVVLVCIYSFIEDLYVNLNFEELSLFKKLFLIASVFAVLSFPFLSLRGIFMGKELFVQTKIFELLKRVGVILVTVILLYFNYGVVSLVFAFGLVPLLIYIVEAVFLCTKGIKPKLFYFNIPIAKSLTTLSIWLFIIVLGEMFITNISPSILAAVSTIDQIAVFSIGLSLYSYVYAFAGAINGFFLPYIYRHKKNGQQLDNISIIVSSIQMFIVGFFVVGIICLGKPFIILWVGEDFSLSYYVACILLIPTIVVFCQPIESTSLFACNKVKYRSLMMICSALVSCALSFFLSPFWGAVGASVSIAVSNIIFMCVGLNIVYRKILHSPIGKFCKLLFRYCLAYFITIACAYELIKFYQPDNWQSLVMCGLIYTVVYVVIVTFLAIPSIVKEKYLYPFWFNLVAKYKYLK